MLAVSLACGAATGGNETEEPPLQPQVDPTQPPPVEEPTQPPAPEPTEPPAPTATVVEQSEYFTEEFDQDPGWDFFLTSGDEDKVTTSFEDSKMIFELEDTDIYAYYLYEDQEYDDVRIDLRAENRGRNNNNVSLVCRASEDGWYEFSTEGGGVWYLYGVTVNDQDQAVYNVINNGGALALKQGKETNDYAMVCNGSEITLFINDKEIIKVSDNDYGHSDGYVGFNISSLNVTPIIVDVDWFKVSEP
jgi:hypothetical protein